MTTNNENPVETETPRRKGGADGKAKGASPKTRDERESGQAPQAEVAPEPEVTSRRITTSNK